MTELICDICGTSYPDTAPQCPTCGYSRAFDAATFGAGADRSAREKVPGGRFSRKNVQERLSKLTGTEEEPRPEETPEEVDHSIHEEVPESASVQPEIDEAALKAYRREVGLNIALAAALVVFLGTGGYLLVQYVIPWLRTLIG